MSHTEVLSEMTMARLLRALRDRYPTASIRSDLLTVVGDQFVVKVTIEAEASLSVTGLGADAHIEVAEDRARQRAVEAIGLVDTGQNGRISAQLSTSVPSMLPLQATLDQPVHPSLENGTAEFSSQGEAASSTVNHRDSDPSDADVGAVDDSEDDSDRDQPHTPHLKDTKPVYSQPDSATPDRSPAVSATPPPETPKKRSSTSAAVSLDHSKAKTSEPLPTPISPSALPAPINLSDVIAQTDIELRRLGWTVEGGRDYLEKTYNKRSRHELTEEELIQFLCHLESLSGA